MKLLSGRVHPQLAIDLGKAFNIPLVSARFHTFPDQEITVEILESLQGESIFILQPTPSPVNNNLMELFLMIDAVKRAGAQQIKVICPYFGYARQNHTAVKLIADFINACGIDHFIAIDLHAHDIPDFFIVPITHLSPTLLFATDIKARHQDIVIVSPDHGAIPRAEDLAHECCTEVIILEKQRPGQSTLKIHHQNLTGKVCILIDDIIDSGHTLCQAALALSPLGPKGIHAYASHGLLSSPTALERLNKSPIQSLTLLDTLDLNQKKSQSVKMRTLSVLPLLAHTLMESF